MGLGGPGGELQSWLLIFVVVVVVMVVAAGPGGSARIAYLLRLEASCVQSRRGRGHLLLRKTAMVRLEANKCAKREPQQLNF